MLGLPDGVRACLFDLDGVLTDTATVHAAAWKETFDAFLRRRAERTGDPFVPFDPVADYDRYVDGKPRADGVAGLPRRAGHRRCPRATPDDPPDAATVHGLGNRKNELRAASASSGDGVEVYDGLGALRAGRPRGRAAPRRRVLQRQHRAGARRRRARRPLRRAGRRRSSAERRHLRGKPAPDTFLAGAERARRRAARRRRCSRTRWPGWRPAGPAGSASWSASTGSARPTRCARTAPTSSSTDLAELLAGSR